jgi:ornithine carbamoyltransferase
MLRLETKHLLTGEELAPGEILGVLDFAEQLRQERKEGRLRTDLAGQSLALLFEKPSLRTRVSFTVAMQELGGQVVECLSTSRKQEEPEDVARVLAGYCHGIMVRTFEQKVLERMASKSPVPVINGLSDSHHPCQILADLLTLKQHYGSLQGVELAYVGDGNNILQSLLLLAPLVGVKLRYACPQGFEPNAFVVKKAKKRAKEGGGSIAGFSDPVQAVKGANAVYTDVWASMGFETEKEDRERHFQGFQLNEELYAHAAPGALVMHCMPMERGKEISEGMADHASAVLFRQSENRLHAQKAVLLGLMVK